MIYKWISEFAIFFATKVDITWLLISPAYFVTGNKLLVYFLQTEYYGHTSR